MRLLKAWLCLAAFLAAANAATAQTTTGTIAGHVVDSQGGVLPGVAVSVSSPNLQGVRTVTTSGNGDYIVTLLPPGTYTIVFELSGFQKQERTGVNVAPTQNVPISVTMGPAALSETINVVGTTADVLTQTAQVATNFKQDLIASLPTNRDLNAAMLLAPAVHPTGPSGAYSVSGSMSFETNFMVNGVNVNDNIRGTANNLYIEDAVQETTIATAGVSAEYGRFQGGVVNVITKSGGNAFGGSFRDTLNNDNWRSLTPFVGDTKIDKTVPTYEYTLGGPIAKDHLWFFTAGRLVDQQSSNQTRITTIPYTFDDKQRRFEGKGTYSFNSNNTVQGTYTKITREQANNRFNANVMDLNSLNTRKLPQDLYSVNYNGILSPTFFVEGRFSGRHFSFVGDGAPTTDLINGTLLIDNQRVTRYWSPTFCGVCDPEKRDNVELFVKGSYFASTRGFGSHNVVAGFDTFNDKRFANNHQSGSDFRILGTTSIIQGTSIFPQFLGDGTTTIQYNPILVGSLGTNFRTNSAFVNDNWRVNNHLTANLGLRFDKNDGKDSAGNLVAKDHAFSPRVGVVWDPKGDGSTSVTTSFAKYVAAIANSIADASSPGGNPATFTWIYRGPSINADPNAASLTTSPAAIRQVFDWFNSVGGQNLRPFNSSSIPGVSTKIPDGLSSPSVLEYAVGVNHHLGGRGAVRVDYVFRDYRDFYATRRDATTGRVTNDLGTQFDLGIVQNTDTLSRRYQGVSTSATYRLGTRLDVGGNYTLSHTYGNVDGENTGSGPITATTLSYPEYKDPAWNYPNGDLLVDQRHRAKAWANYQVPRVSGLMVSVLQDVQSGVPYGAIGGVDVRPVVGSLNYVTPQGGNSVNYYFTARDAYRTDTSYRTDMAVSYSYKVKAGSGPHVELFGQAQVLNVFNGFQICGCGANVFSNGGGVDLANTIDTSVLTRTNSPSYTTFNPFTTTPVQGVNWALGPNFGKPVDRTGYTSPREFRVTFGVRF